MTDEQSSDETPEKPVQATARWGIPYRIDFLTFIGRDVVAVSHGLYLVFINLRTGFETIYVASDKESGDGVDIIAGYRTNIFAFSEKTNNARIFIVSYPSFSHLCVLQDTEVNRYKGICMMECDLVAGFSGFPNYLLIVWSWRNGQRLIRVPTGVIRRQQIYAASRTHMLLCECWGDGIIVWEIAQCYKKNFYMKRCKEEHKGWEVTEPPIVDVCWSTEGPLYAVDCDGDLFCVISDGIKMMTKLEWSAKLTGTASPAIAWLGNGIVYNGKDYMLRYLKKVDSKWVTLWEYQPLDQVEQMRDNHMFDTTVVWTNSGAIYRLTVDNDDKIDITLVAYKQRGIIRLQVIEPDCTHLATLNKDGVLCIYLVRTGKLVKMAYIKGDDIFFEASPVEPVLAIYGEMGVNYGLAMYQYSDEQLIKTDNVCLTNQIVSRVVFSPTGRHLMAAAMSAGHVFIYNVSEDYKLSLVRYAELGRGIADCLLMKVGTAMRAFSLVLFSDKYTIGERVMCINAETGRDNKFAGKMQGPYSRLLPVSTPDTLFAIPHLSMHYHLLKLSGDKGVTVTVKMGAILQSGHLLKQFSGYFSKGAILTYGFDGQVIVRKPHAPVEYDLIQTISHRYESAAKGVRQVIIDSGGRYIIHLGGNHIASVRFLDTIEQTDEIRHDPPDPSLFDRNIHTITIINSDDLNYLELQEEQKVREETIDYKQQRDEVVKTFESIQERLVVLLEENIAEVPLHQLPLSEFDLHVEQKKERNKAAEKEREEIRLKTEALIKAQDKVTAWIKETCWDSMLTPRIKIYAIFSHYQAENYPTIPSQRPTWPELEQIEWLRTIEMENDAEVFRPWLEIDSSSEIPDIFNADITTVKSSSFQMEKSSTTLLRSTTTSMQQVVEASDENIAQPDVFAHSTAHKCISVPSFAIPQTLAYSYLHMNWVQNISRLNVQNMRIWYNKQFADLMAQKKREVGLVVERNARLRFIIEELNKLSDLRESFHHLTIAIHDPEWKQEEEPEKLIKVDPEECSIEPYISPSQIVIVPPDPGPKDDFRERALMYMMDGVLEKLWHEEIKKPIPKPQCMLEKEPEHFTEEDLRVVFEYERMVEFRNSERDKYRKMLHAEYAKLTQILNEGIVKFNHKVKEMWLLKLKCDSIIGQENLLMMRLRRTNLDRLEMAEKMEDMRAMTYKLEKEVEDIQHELKLIQEQSDECNAAYEALAAKDRALDKSFKNHFSDLSPIIVDQCYKFFKKRPKWPVRTTMIPIVLYEMATAIITGVKPPMLHPDCYDYMKAVDQLDMISNMPPVMDEGLWVTMCKLRRIKIENEIRMRGIVQETGYVDSAQATWNKAIYARKQAIADLLEQRAQHRTIVETNAINKTIHLVLPAGQVEIITTGHIEDFEDAALIPREDIDLINSVILKVGAIKLRMMRKQMEFRKGILSKEWEHAQMKMKLRHMQQELYSYTRLKIPKELQLYLKNKTLGYTEEMEYLRMEKESQATRASVNKMLNEEVQRVEQLEVKINSVKNLYEKLNTTIDELNVKVSEKRLHHDPLEPIRIRRVLSKRMELLMQRGTLIREVQQNHTTIVMLQTELELLRLKTYPTLASFRTIP